MSKVLKCTMSTVKYIRDPFHKGLMSSPPKSYENTPGTYMTSFDLIRSKFCMCHDSSVVMAPAELWPNQIIEIRIKSKWNSHRILIMNSICEIDYSLPMHPMTLCHTDPECCEKSWAFEQSSPNFADVIFNAFLESKYLDFRHVFIELCFIWFDWW